jgi:hypothetical protein
MARNGNALRKQFLRRGMPWSESVSPLERRRDFSRLGWSHKNLTWFGQQVAFTPDSEVCKSLLCIDYLFERRATCSREGSVADMPMESIGNSRNLF